LEAAKKAVSSASEEAKASAQEALDKLQEIYQSYRVEIQTINKTIHPLNEQDEWTTADAIERGLLHCFTSINKIALPLSIEFTLEKASKVLAQISPIAQGVQTWIGLTKLDLEQWVAEQLITEQEREWLIRCALPKIYWQIQLDRTQAKLRNQDLRTYYKERIAAAHKRWASDDFTKQMEIDRLEYLMLLAQQVAITFQRASSQTEGRNGYLSFVNHAHRGIPKERLKVLTVIHNYDIKRADGTTPARRLFRRDFPDLFEFLCLNVTGFKEPRRRKSKSLNINVLQH